MSTRTDTELSAPSATASAAAASLHESAPASSSQPQRGDSALHPGAAGPGPTNPTLQAILNSASLPWVLLAFRLALGGIFIYAGYLKVLDPIVFGDSIASYQLLPAALINIVALALPPLEIILGVWLITGIQVRYPSFGILALSIVFAIGITQGLIRGISIDCGCFGGGGATSPWVTLGRDIAIMIAAFVVYTLTQKSPGSPRV